jgi:mRNA interferase RelE/StbE
LAEVLFLDAAIEDLEELDGGALRLVLGKIRVLFTDPEAGHPLGRTPTGNLTGFRKLVVGDRAYRRRLPGGGQRRGLRHLGRRGA